MRLVLDFIYKHFIYLLLGSGIFFIFVNFSYLHFNSADASLYLSTAENIADHRGFVVSDNLYQQFNTLYHPVFPYYQPLYSLFASLFIHHGGIVSVIQVNILIFAVNAILLLYMLQKLVPTRLNILFILYLVFSINFFISALYAWTEQFYLLCLIITILLFLKHSRSAGHLLWLGVINGILMLVRVAHFYNFAAFLVVLLMGKDAWRLKLGRALSFAGGFILAFGLYQVFCFLRYHAFYPECATQAMYYKLAHQATGIIYSLKAVGIHVVLGSVFTLNNAVNIIHHIGGFCHQIPLISLPVLLYYFLPAGKRKDGGMVELCFVQGLFTILGYSVTFYSVIHFPNFELTRYSLIPFVLMSLCGWFCLYQGLTFLESRWKKVLYVILWASLIYPQAIKFIKFETDITHDFIWQKPFYVNLFDAYRWIDRNLPGEALVASVDDQQNYFMHRPFISLPPARSFICGNLTLFNKIYAPGYYLLSKAVPDKCFALVPHTTIYTNKIFRLYQVNPS